MMDMPDGVSLAAADEPVVQRNRRHRAGHWFPTAWLILLFSDEAACAPFRSRSWIADVIATSHVDVMVVDLPADVRDAVLAAQRRQYR
jgi:hypothetical protein